MSELKDLLERADRAIRSLPLPGDGLDRLSRYRRRRRTTDRLVAGLVAAAVLIVGAASAAGIRGIGPGGRGEGPSSHHVVRPSFELPPAEQRILFGEPAQRVGEFWIGTTESLSCVRAMPLAIGASWTLSGGSSDCLLPGPGAIRAGSATGTVHHDGSQTPPTRFFAVYGIVSNLVSVVRIQDPDGREVIVTPACGRFLYASAVALPPVTVLAIASDGRIIGSAHVEPRVR
jgi:hypothetical protein